MLNFLGPENNVTSNVSTLYLEQSDHSTKFILTKALARTEVPENCEWTLGL